MADKELRRMNRSELIEIIYALQQNEELLRQENQRLREELDEKRIKIENAGSIAEASLSLSHIFEDAQKAADLYLTSVRQAEEEKRAALEEARGMRDKLNEEMNRRETLHGETN